MTHAVLEARAPSLVIVFVNEDGPEDDVMVIIFLVK